MVVEVLVEIKAKKIDQTFTYKVPSNLIKEVALGKRVLVPFNKRKIEGFILKINKDNLKYDYELKEILTVIDENPVLNKEFLKLGEYISKKTLSPLISAYQTMLPTALKAKKGVVVGKKYEKYLKLSPSFDLNKVTSSRQQEIIDLLKKEKRCLKKKGLALSPSAVNTLLKKGLIIEEEEEVYRLNNDEEWEVEHYILTKDQEAVITKINNKINTFQPFLLHGVTGSGKTEVYINVILEVLKKGQESIVLVPEISLTPQMVNNFKGRFGNQIAVIHSRLSRGEKYDEWRKIERGEVSIVIGARSAIFAPFTNLGIIIIDEEHSMTYKQEQTPKYQTIDIALHRARNHRCPVVLGSATPSIESYTRAKMGIYQLLELKERINKSLPLSFLIDMKKEIKQGRPILSKFLIDNIDEALNQDKQILLFLNRRGYTTVMTCYHCGHTIKCPNCDIPLIYHKTINKMRCHYCDYTINKIESCPSCQSKDINQFGLGTQKLEEEIKKRFSQAKVVRMDIDTTRKKGSHERIIRAFKEGEYNFLIGTQMISKGLDFEKVTLVGVLNGDASLNIPDFRSAERTFQLLSQVSGRAGRGDYKGKVIIQTFNQDHYSIVLALKNDYSTFYQKELAIRSQLGYPPFYNLALVKISSLDYELACREASKISNYLKSKVGKEVFLLGPSSSSRPKINNVYYLQIVIKYKDTNKLIPLFKDLNNLYKNSRKVLVDIDINPLRL